MTAGEGDQSADSLHHISHQLGTALLCTDARGELQSADTALLPREVQQYPDTRPAGLRATDTETNLQDRDRHPRERTACDSPGPPGPDPTLGGPDTSVRSHN